MTLKIGMDHWVVGLYQVLQIVTLVDHDLLYAKVKFSHFGICMGKRQSWIHVKLLQPLTFKLIYTVT